MRTLTAYLVGVILVLAVVNFLAWSIGGWPRLHVVGIFTAGFLLGAIGMYIAAHVYGYRRMP